MANSNLSTIEAVVREREVSFPLDSIAGIKTEFVLSVDSTVSEDILGTEGYQPAFDLCDVVGEDEEGNEVYQTNEEFLEMLTNIDFLPFSFFGMRQNVDKLENFDPDGNKLDFEGNNMFRQYIGYVVVCADEKLTPESEVFVYSRNKGSTETRLVNCCSIGIGGHVAINDVVINDETGNIDAYTTIMDSIVRETSEELKLPEGTEILNNMTFEGFLQDFETDVNSLHLALVFHLRLDPRTLTTGEVELAHLEPRTLRSFMEDSREESPLEPWSYSIAEYVCMDVMQSPEDGDDFEEV